MWGLKIGSIGEEPYFYIKEVFECLLFPFRLRKVSLIYMGLREVNPVYGSLHKGRFLCEKQAWYMKVK